MLFFLGSYILLFTNQFSVKFLKIITSRTTPRYLEAQCHLLSSILQFQYKFHLMWWRMLLTIQRTSTSYIRILLLPIWICHPNQHYRYIWKKRVLFDWIYMKYSRRYRTYCKLGCKVNKIHPVHHRRIHQDKCINLWFYHLYK
jgi:hypothetical protein